MYLYTHVILSSKLFNLFQITTDYIPENQTVQYSALDDYKPGDQVFIFYGERSNAELLVHNG